MIKSVLTNASYVGYICTEETTGKKKLLLYNHDGKEVLSKALTFDYEKVYLSGDELLFMSSRRCNILRTNGKDKFTCSFTSDVKDFLPASDGDYYLLDDNAISQIRLK